MTQHRKHRGYASQRIVADYFAANGWPYAEPVGAGRTGSDVTGMLGWMSKSRPEEDWIFRRCCASWMIEQPTGILASASSDSMDKARPALLTGPPNVECNFEGTMPAFVYAKILTTVCPECDREWSERL